MKKYYVLFLLFCFQTIIPAQEKYNYSESVNKFAFDMYEQLIKNNDGNVAFSPLGLYTALAQLYIGSYGEARDEIGKALYIEEGNEEFLNDFGCFLDSIVINRKEESLTLSIANALLINSNIKIDDWYRGSVKKYLHSDVLCPDNIQEAKGVANNWVKGKTFNNIKNIFSDKNKIQKNALLNVLFFQDSLEEGFHKKLTQKDDFYLSDGLVVESEFMFLRGLFHCFDMDDFKIIRLPYKKGTHDLFLIFSNVIEGFNQLENKVRNMQLKELIRWSFLDYLDFYMPKFNVDFEYENLVGIFKQSGIRNIFIPDSVSRNLSKNTKLSCNISQVTSKIKFEVNENGDKHPKGKYWKYDMIHLNPEYKLLYLNYPFIYMLVEKKRNSILLFGRCMNPLGDF